MNSLSSLKWHHGIWAFIVASVLQISFGIILEILNDGDAQARLQLFSSAPRVAMQIAISAGMFALVAVIFAQKGPARPAANLSLRPTHIQIFLLGVVGVLAFGVLTDELTSALFRHFPERFNLNLLEQLGRLFHDASTADFLLLTLAITVGPACGEELLFRGILLNSFTRRGHGVVTIVLSSLFFGIMHMDMMQGAGAFLLGLYLGYLVYRSGSIWPGIFAHGINNLVVSLTARFETTGLRETLEHGHSPAILALAGGIAALAIVGIEKVLRSGRKNAADHHISS